MPLTRDGRTAIHDFPVAFEDHVRPDLGVQRALDEIALASHAPSTVTHGVGGGNDFAAVVGGVRSRMRSIIFASSINEL